MCLESVLGWNPNRWLFCVTLIDCIHYRNFFWQKKKHFRASTFCYHTQFYDKYLWGTVTQSHYIHFNFIFMITCVSVGTLTLGDLNSLWGNHHEHVSSRGNQLCMDEGLLDSCVEMAEN